MRVAALLGALCLGAVACGQSSDAPVKLDGSPRRPDAEGVVVKASASGLTLDGKRSYEVSKKLVSFSTYNRKVVPLASTVGSYVQVGVNGDTVVWLSKIGPVATGADGKRTVQYQGDLVDVDSSDLIFKDGTVLRLGKGLTPPADPLGPTYVVLDADEHVVQGATFPPRSKK